LPPAQHPHMAAVSRVGPPTPCPSTFRTCICVSGQAAHEGTMPVSKVMAVITVFIVTASGVPTPLMPDRFVGKEADIHANQAGVVDCCNAANINICNTCPGAACHGCSCLANRCGQAPAVTEPTPTTSICEDETSPFMCPGYNVPSLCAYNGNTYQQNCVPGTYAIPIDVCWNQHCKKTCGTCP